jgi:membrane peptidoglycan carboxypeptidase
VAGAGIAGFTYYSTTVKLPDQIELPLSSTIMYAGGSKQLAKLGEVNRTLVKINDIPADMQHAVASAEDRNFYKHDGVDYAGIARAAWNNFTGGDTQGASTITQQYARNALDLEGVSYARKVREAVLASKLADKYSREQIMEFYLNTVYWGRGAYSVESAAQAYFGKQPVPDKVTGNKGFDPQLNPVAAKDRWNYVLDGMVEKGWLDAGKRQSLKYPVVLKWDPKKACVAECGFNTPAGNVINYVTAEMAEMGLCDEGHCMDELRKGGYKVTTSIDPDMQKAAEDIAWRARPDSELAGQPKNLMAAVVSVDPNTGRVLSYFGGSTGSGHDFAGKNLEGGQWTGGHPPGSSFKVYTLATALENNISMQSRWSAKPFKDDGHSIGNAGRRPKCNDWCTLEESTVQSYNVPFYHIAKELGPEKVVELAKKAGVTMMWPSGKGEAPVDLTKPVTAKQLHSKFAPFVGYGQYPITVLDHANGLATLAARGIYRKAHFVVKIEQKDHDTGKWIKKGGEKLAYQRAINPQVVDDVTATLVKIPRANGHALKDGRDAAGKTGTWELNETSSDNAHAWMVGYTPQVATAVWVGNVKDEKAIKDKNGQKIQGSRLPGDIWERYMNKVHEGKEVKNFPPASNIGDDDAGNGKSPPPTDPSQPPCVIPVLCPPNNQGGQDNNGGNNDGPGGGRRNGDGNGNGPGGGPPILPPPPPN